MTMSAPISRARSTGKLLRMPPSTSTGISLYDRALFIGTLFKEDYALYDKTISELNALSTLDEAVDYLLERFPDWNLKSDIVYNFMMAIRKKLG